MSGQPRNRSVGINWQFICLFPPTIYTSLYPYVLSTVLRKSNFTLHIFNSYIQIFIKQKGKNSETVVIESKLTNSRKHRTEKFSLLVTFILVSIRSIR